MMACVILMIACLVVPASAADAAPTVSGSGNVDLAGGTITFTVSLPSSVDGVGSGALTVSFDADTLEVVSGECLVSGAFISTFDTKTLKGAFAFQTATAVSGNLFEVTLKAKEGASVGACVVEFTVDLKNANDAYLTVDNSAAKGTATITCRHASYAEVVEDKYLASKATCTAKAKYYKSCAACGTAGTDTFENGDLVAHNFTNKDTADKYIKEYATCSVYAKYYFSCQACGAAGTDTFDGTTYAPHDYSNEVVLDIYKVSDADCENPIIYLKSCTGCAQKGTETFTRGNALGHDGGKATCTAKAVCTRCAQQYGELLPHSYVKEIANPNYLKSEANCKAPATYYKSCECGAKGNAATFTVGEKDDHKFVENTNEIYLKQSADCDKPSIYYKSCETCGIAGTETFEASGATGHKWSAEYITDKDSHWYQCSKCGAQKDLAKHVAGPAATEFNDQICTVCDYIIAPKLEHKCSFDTSKWVSNMTGHWHGCFGCSARMDEENHVYDNACDATCSKCGYERGVMHTYKTTYTTDENNHWNECTVCGKKINAGAHIAGEEATEYNAQTCTVCDYVINPALTHEHKYGEEWMSNEDDHWNVCECGAKGNKAAHVWDDGVVTVEPTVKAKGEKTFTCTVCEATKVEEVAKLPTPTAPAKTTAPITTAPDPSNNGGDGNGDANANGGCGGCGGCGGVVGSGAIAFAIIGLAGLAVTAKKKED